jgi:hypothetical protein
MIIHALNHAKNNHLKSLLQVRSQQGSLFMEQKTLIMKMLSTSKSLEYTLEVLNELQGAIVLTLEKMESGIVVEKNWMLRAIMARYKVVDPHVHS